MVNIPIEKLQFEGRSFRNNTLIKENERILDISVKNEANGLKLFLVETPPELDNIPEEDLVEVLFYATKKGWGYGSSNEFSFVRRVKMSKKKTTK